MGVDVDALLIVGAKGSDINVESVTDNESLYEFAEENGMEICSPYYDCCDYEEQIIGIEISYYNNDEDLVKKIKEAKDKFLELANTSGEFMAAPNVY